MKVGDIVRVKNPDSFKAEWKSKLKDRDGVVEWIGPDDHGQFHGYARVKFLKRNGRGKEFVKRMRVDSFIVTKEAA